MEIDTYTTALSACTATLFMLSYIYSFAHLMNWVYLLQIKEYRLDRTWSTFKKKPTTMLFLFQQIKRPAKSIRNLGIFLFSSTFLFLYNIFLIILTWPKQYDLTTNIENLLTPYLINHQILTPAISMPLELLNICLAPLLVIVAVLLSQPMADLLKKRKIAQARKKLATSNVKVIGITGSYGKSSVKTFLLKLLESSFNVVATPHNYNTDIGIAIAINQYLKNHTDFFIVEMGAYRQGEIKDITDFTHPQYGILTGLGNQHLDLFGSRKNLLETKRELFEALPGSCNNNDSDGGSNDSNNDSNSNSNSNSGNSSNVDSHDRSCGKAYFNIDNPDYDSKNVLADISADVRTYSIHDKSADMFLSDMKYNKISTMTKFTVIRQTGNNATRQQKSLQFSTKLLGIHNIQNLLPCIGLALDLGVSLKELKKSVRQLRPIPSKLSTHKGINDIHFLDDSYNSNVNGFLTAINVLITASKQPTAHFNRKTSLETVLGMQKQSGASKLLVVSNGIIELGKEKLLSYRKIVKELITNDIVLATTDKDFMKVYSDLVKNKVKSSNILNKKNVKNKLKLFKNEVEIMKFINQDYSANDTVLIEGRFSPNFMKGLVLRKICL